MKLGGLVALLACSACGDVKDNSKLPDAPVQQDGRLDDADVDAPDVDAPPPRCDPQKPFGAPVPITELNVVNINDTSPALTPDELTLTFTSTRNGGSGAEDAYITTRASKTAAWSAPSLIAGVNTGGRDSRPIMPADQLSMYFEYNPSLSGGEYNIYVSTRASTSTAFSTPVALTAVNLTGNDVAPYVLPDHSAMYLVNTRMLYRATRTGTTWNAPALVTGTNLQAGDFDYPISTPDELTIYFASSRSPSTGNNDIWMAKRASVVTGFDMPTNVTELNTTTPDVPGWVSADNCVMYLTRNIGTVASDYNIFRAEKPL